VNTSDERSTDCQPTNYGSGRSAFWVSKTIFRSGFGQYNHADRSILIEQGQSDSRSHRRETRPRKSRVSRRVHGETQQLDRFRGIRTDRHPKSTWCRDLLQRTTKTTRHWFWQQFRLLRPASAAPQAVWNAVSYSMYPLKDRLMRALNAE